MASEKRQQLIQSSIIILQIFAYLYFITIFLFLDSFYSSDIYYLNPERHVGIIQKIYFIFIMSINSIGLVLLFFNSILTKWDKIRRAYIILAILALPFSIAQLVYILATKKPNIKFFSYWDMTYREIFKVRALFVFGFLICTTIYMLLLSVTRITTLFENEYINHTVKYDYQGIIQPMGDYAINFNGYIIFHYDENNELYQVDVDMYYYDIRSSEIDPPNGSLVIGGIPLCESTQDGLFNNNDFSCIIDKNQLTDVSDIVDTIEFMDITGNRYTIDGDRSEKNEVYHVNVLLLNIFEE